MDRRQFLAAGMSAFTASAFLSRETAWAWQAGVTPPPLPAPGADGWIQLFNGKNLDNLYVVLQNSGVNGDKVGQVTVENGMLHLLAQKEISPDVEQGFVATKHDFGDVHVQMEYKWGTNKFRPTTPRDNGLLYRITGPDTVFPTCVEFQMSEIGHGNASFLGGARGVQGVVDGFPSRGRGAGAPVAPQGGAPAAQGGQAPPAAPAAPPAPAPAAPVVAGGQQTPAPGGPGGEGRGGGRPGGPGGRGGRGGGGGRGLTREADYEKPDDWNTLEVIMRGDTAVQIVNGNVVLTIRDLQRPDPDNQGQFLPLTRGKIGLQMYYMETWVRKIAVKNL